jgi:Coenzyme PQQ synthesis protein D (PqqD)
MKPSRYVARSKSIAARGLGDETMVMSATNSTLFTLNEVASEIWNAADGVTPLEEIVKSRVCSQFDIAPEAALEDAEVLVENLASHGLLLVSPEPFSKPGNSCKESS